jgi:hypothetical protein
LAAALCVAGVLLAAGAAYLAWHSFHSPTGSNQLAAGSALNGTGGGTETGRRDDTARGTDRQPTPTDTGPEGAVRQVVEHFYDLLSRKDEDGLQALYRSDDPANLVAGRRAAMHNIVADTGKITVDKLAVDRIRVNDDRAIAHSTVVLSARNAQTGKPYFSDKPMEINWEFAKEGSAWKISGFTVVTDEATAAAIRAFIERYHDLLVKKDADGLVGLYARETTLGTVENRRSAMKEMFAETGPITVRSLKVGNMTVLGENAAVYVYVQLEAMNVKTGRPYFPDTPMTQSWSLVREADGWKLLQYTSKVE